MLPKRGVRGRQQLALVASIDAVLLSYAVLLMLLALDMFDTRDFVLLGVHMLHGLSALIAYLFVRHNTTSLETLRLLLTCYSILFVVDIVICVGRVMMLGHQHQDVDTHRHVNAAVRLGLAVAFIIVDVSGAFFANLAQDSSMALHYSNEQLSSIADHSLYDTQSGANA